MGLDVEPLPSGGQNPRGQFSSQDDLVPEHLTKLLNHRQKKVGHLFSGRYKSLLVEENEYLTTLIYYLHLNPIRAGLGHQAIEDYEWSSLRDYVGAVRNRRSFVAVVHGLRHLQLEDTSADRKRLLEMTLKIAKQEGRLQKDDGLSLQIKRGWLYGSEAFRGANDSKTRRHPRKKRPSQWLCGTTS